MDKRRIRLGMGGKGYWVGMGWDGRWDEGARARWFKMGSAWQGVLVGIGRYCSAMQ